MYFFVSGNINMEFENVGNTEFFLYFVGDKLCVNYKGVRIGWV